jgi:hypothetical protein
MRWISHASSDRMIVLHSGTHGHQIPHVPKADFHAKQALRELFQANANAKPSRLVVGTPLCPSTRTIHQAFGNKSRVGYFQRQWLREMGVTLPGNHPGGCFLLHASRLTVSGYTEAALFDQLIQFQDTYGADVILSNDLRKSRMHVSVANAFMLQRYCFVL